ncbi:MAG: MFS transporter [Rhodocyclaceae bacterium]
MKPIHVNPQIFSLIAVSLLAHVTMSGGRVTAALYALQHGGSEILAGVAYSLYNLLPVFLSLACGRWIDRVGPRRVMRWSLAMMVAGLALPAAWDSIYAVFGTAILSGLGFSNYMLAAHVAVGLMPFERETDRVGMFGWLQMGNSISAVVGPSITGAMIDLSGFRAAFGMLAAIVMASLICAFRVNLPDGRRAQAAVAGGANNLIATVLRDPRLMRVYLVAMTISLSWDGFVFMAPVLGHARGYSATEVGMVLSAFACGTFSVRALLPWLSRVMSEWRMLAVAFGMSAVVFLALPFVHLGWLHALMGFVFGLAAGAGHPNTVNLIYRYVPREQVGEGVGLRSMTGNLTGLFGPSLFGAISALFGVVPVFLLVGGVMGASSWQARVGGRLAAAMR